MIIYSILISKNTLPTLVNHVKHFTVGLGTKKCLVRSFRTFRSMSEKVSQNKTYVAVDVNGTNPAPQRSKILGFFRRHGSKEGVKGESKTEVEVEVKVERGPRISKSDLNRLFSLAKPEKWRLMGE